MLACRIEAGHVAYVVEAVAVTTLLTELEEFVGQFTPPGVRIDVRCEVAGDRVSLHVTDTGIGIPAERLESVFEPFVQVHRTLKDPTGGVGLGLAISRDLARGMGGELTVESTGAGGSTFTITLPRALH